MRGAFLGVLVVATLCIAGFGQDVPAGFGAASFARIGIDARPLAMGGTGVAVATGSPIPYYNPANLARILPITAGGMYSEPYGPDLGVSFQSMSALGGFLPQTDSQTRIGAGVTWIQMKIDDIPVWDEDDPGQVTMFTATSSLYLASAAVTLSPEISIGATAKVYRERILDGRGRGAGVDIGVLASFEVEGTPLTVGINAMDLAGSNIRWLGTVGEPDNYVPWVNKIGASATFFDGMALFACDFDWAVGRPAREQKVHVGVEVNPVGPLFLRGGWSTDLEGSDSKISAGLGVELLDWFRLDYAYVPARTVFGTGHFLSLRLSIPLFDEE